MLPIISIVGKSESGKTTLLEQLIRELKARGYRLAAIKHSTHELAPDQPGKDSWRLAQAGSDTVVLSSPGKISLFKEVDHKATVEELFHLVGGEVDLVLTEGFKEDNALKIEVHRSELGEPVCAPEELIAIVTDVPLDTTVPQFSHADIKAVADLIEKAVSPTRNRVALMVNGVSTHLNPFVEDFMTKTLLGMVSALKGVENIKNLQMWLRRGKD